MMQNILRSMQNILFFKTRHDFFKDSFVEQNNLDQNIRNPSTLNLFEIVKVPTKWCGRLLITCCYKKLINSLPSIVSFSEVIKKNKNKLGISKNNKAIKRNK